MKLIYVTIYIMEKFLITTAIIYFSIGFIMAIGPWNRELKTFDCLTPNEPHGYVRMGIDSFTNPDPEHCIRRGFTIQSITSAATVVAIGTPIIIARIYIRLQ